MKPDSSVFEFSMSVATHNVRFILSRKTATSNNIVEQTSMGMLGYNGRQKRQNRAVHTELEKFFNEVITKHSITEVSIRIYGQKRFVKRYAKLCKKANIKVVSIMYEPRQPSTVRIRRPKRG